MQRVRSIPRTVASTWLLVAAMSTGSVPAIEAPPGTDAAEKAAGLPSKATNGPRTSPFDPQEEDDRTFTTDSAAGLDTGCTFSSRGPLEFDIEITRHVGELNGDGTLAKAAELVDAGLLSEFATLIIPGFDVDANASPPAPFVAEMDRVLWNGEEIGFLTGENNAWKLSSFEIPINKVKFAPRGAIGSEPPPAMNRVTIEIDVGNAPTEVWCTSADWGTASFKAMSPIILIHGNNSNGGFFERQGFTGELDDRNLLWDNSVATNPAAIAFNGGSLDVQIPLIVRSFGVDSVHFVAHSKGGLDSREYLARHQPSHQDDFEVLSYSTLSTPHDGSVLADFAILREQGLRRAVDTEYRGFPTFTARVAAQIELDGGTPNLTTAFTAAFNAGNLPNLSGDTVINTTSADADTNGDGAINRDPDEYAELRAESQELQDLDGTFGIGQQATRIGINIPYQILRNTRAINLTFEEQRRFLVGPKRTVAVLTAVPSAGPIGNDVLVTIPSGRGDGSVAGRSANHRTFNGAQGRNHSNIADGGVAQVVVPWLIDVERGNGDLQ